MGIMQCSIGLVMAVVIAQRYEKMKLERYVTVVFDLKHKFVGLSPLCKVFFTQRLS